MAYGTTRAIIRDDARDAADQVNSDFRSDARIDRKIDVVWAEVYEHILIAQPERYLASFSFTTSPGISTYAITPEDFYKMKDLEANVNGRTVTLDMFAWENRNRYQDAMGWDYAQPAAWRLYGDNVVFVPRPNGEYLVTCWYHPAPIKFPYDDATIDTIAGYEEAVVFGVARKLALEEEDLELADRLTAEYQRQLQRVLEFGAVRVTEKVEYARDLTRSDWEDMGFGR